ncbi:molecular chaperone DnaJ [candidate division WOR-3 bacterium]|jgi:hypothetical protein|nr:molecular chaperone DnaJ [candidate division WOR-3 bacterium]
MIAMQKPEEVELARKKEELSALEAELTQRELDLETLKATLRGFESRYLRIVGVLLAELDDVEAQIAEAEMDISPNNTEARNRANEASAKARVSAEAVGDVDTREDVIFKPTDDLKRLYREVAKQIHPDLCRDERQRQRREKMMEEANRAYEEGDEARLRDILMEWEASPETVQEGGVAAELVRAIRKIAQIRKRLEAIKSEIALITSSDLFKLHLKAETASLEGRDLLDEMAAQVERKISKAKERLFRVTKRIRSL